MVYIRGVKEDYDGWAALGNHGWSYDDVLPYFKKAESNHRGETLYHGGDGPLSVSEHRSPNALNDVFIEAGRQVQLPVNQDFNGSSQEGVGFFDVTQRSGVRCSSAHAYLDRKVNQNLSVITGAYVHKIQIEGKKAVGVDVTVRDDRKTLKANKEVILSAGAFQSPQLLLLSGIGAADKIKPHGIDLVHELPGVGENLHDHLDYSLIYKSKAKQTLAFSGARRV